MLKLDPPEGRLLLHSCCAPCSGAIIECLLQNSIRPTVFFSNSNIFSPEEYAHRLSELKRYCDSLGVETVDDDYDHPCWLFEVKGLENEPERGGRCAKCFEFRLLRAARWGRAHGFGVLTTSLASSRWKSLEQVDAAGFKACGAASAEPSGGGEIVWWPQNWRKGGLQPRRGEIIAEQHFYNQTFCGCEFSLK